MNLPLFIAKRYLFSKKKFNTINIISIISACGVALVTAALICTLSVFNGFQELTAQFLTQFDPDLKIVSIKGKVFDPRTPAFQKVETLPQVAVCSKSIVDNAMVRYGDREVMATIKGVESNFAQLTDIDSALYGKKEFLLRDSVVDYGIMGGALMSQLGTGLEFVHPLEVYAPRQSSSINLANPMTAFNRKYLFSPGTIFIVNQELYDAHYILTSLVFARELFGYPYQVSDVEIRLKPGSDVEKVQKRISSLIGDNFKVENRFEQQEDVFKIMKIEKYISYIFLTFILIIASFNMIGSLSMLIIDKKENIATLKRLGADDNLIYKIFLDEGVLISLIGAISGLLFGLLLCWIQETFGIIQLGTADFVIDKYPVSVHAGDVIVIFFTVLLISWLSVRYPVRYLSKRLTA